MGVICLKLIEKFGDSAAAALFWILIIFAFAGALIWMFDTATVILLKEDIKKLTSKKSSEESEE
jgi:hypothetical protein